MAKLIQSFDWSNTPLGPIEHWPVSLKYSVHHCLISKFPVALYCGAEFILIYNDAFIPIVSEKRHAGILGLPCHQTRKDMWPVLHSIIHEVFTSGRTIKKENMLQLWKRSEFLEENYLTCSFSPFGLMEGKIIGVCETAYYNTYQIIHERRLKTFKNLTKALLPAKTSDEVLRLAALSLEKNDAGIPFALLYKLDIGYNFAILKATTRIQPGTECSPLKISLQEPQKKNMWPLDQVIMSRQPLTVKLTSLSPFPSGCWQELPKLANIIPLILEGEKNPTGILIIGVSAVRSYNEDYSNFHKILAEYIVSALKKIDILEKEIQGRKILAELLDLKNIFFKKIRNELYTPLLFVLQTLEDVLSEGNSLEARQIERIRFIKNCTEGLRNIVESLPNLSDIVPAKKEHMKHIDETLDVIGITKEIINMFQSSIERIRISLPEH